MRRVMRGVIFVVLAMGYALAGYAQAEEMSREELQTLYVDYLTEVGYKPEVDKDGDVVFKKGDYTYFINVNEKDQGFFSVVLPSIWAIENEDERSKVLAALDFTNGKMKVTKVFTLNDNVWVATELYVSSPDAFKKVFERALESVGDAADIFASKMKE